MHHPVKKYLAVCLAVVTVALGLFAGWPLHASAQPDGGGHVPYVFSFDTLHTATGSASMIRVFRDMSLELGASMEAAGWLATPEGVKGYEYAWLPTGGGPVTWMPVSDLSICERPDLALAEVPHVTGHQTAGFSFTLTPPEGTPEGYYDVYVRALDGMGVACDMAAILSLKYGTPDEIRDSGLLISFPRIVGEGASALFGDAKITDGNIILPPDGGVRLGNIPLSAYEKLRITYTLTDTTESDDRTPVLGLKSSGRYSFGKDGEKYNVTDSLAFAALSTTANAVEIDLTDCLYNGEVWLTGHLDRKVVITSLELVSVGYGGDRVAAKINFSENVKSYFSGTNRADVLPVKDPVQGDVLRIEVNTETNDPYAHFNAGTLLKTADVSLDANEYKYIVILMRSFAENPHDLMMFYLCAGSIAGATEACTYRYNVKRDGQWHYYLLDLTNTENWNGLINGMRFDVLSAKCQPGQGVEFASMQFFRTYEAAAAAAAQDPAARGAYSMETDPILILDMVEEEGVENGAFVPDPADTYVVTEPETEPTTRPPADTEDDPATQPADTTASPDPLDPDGTDSTTATTPGKGCRSTLPVISVLPVLALLPLFAVKQRSRPKINNQS